MSDKVRLAWGTCPEHGRVLVHLQADRPRCPRCPRDYRNRDTRPTLIDLAPYDARDWDAARAVSELRAVDAAFRREWSPRRHRLAFCALARLYFAHAKQYWLWKAVEAGEAWADADAPSADAGEAFARLGGEEAFERRDPGPAKPGDWTWLALACVCGEAEAPALWDDWVTVRVPPPAFDFTPEKEKRLAPAPAVVYRELALNPFASVAWNPAWRSETVLDLARHIHGTHDFGAMPILADALQDAGCDGGHILDHCRGHARHARGCWVLDAVLGKS